MITNESLGNQLKDWDDLPSAEELRRLTSRDARGEFSSSSLRDGYLAFGELAETAAKDFDWQKMAARLAQEIEAEKPGYLVKLPLRQRSASPIRAIVWISTCSAAMLLIGLAMSMLSQPVHQQAKRPPRPKPLELASATGIDSWERTPSQGDLSGAWNDELDAELAATRRALKQGRDPWVNDEPVLSSVFAQVNELSAGLMFEPF